jgi:quinol monooxygenase YgiN
MIASLHLHRVHGIGIAKSIAHMALDRRSLTGTPGLRFWKLLGTGNSDTFAVRDADPSLWGLFGVWESAVAHQEFLQTSRVVKAWDERADEQWSAELHPIRWKGQWAKRDPFAGFATRGGGREEGGHGGGQSASASLENEVHRGEQIAVLTRARVKPSQWRAFAKAVPPVAAAMKTAQGLRFSLGIGEAPIGLQATFSVWDSPAAIAAFAYQGQAHKSVIGRTATSGWYAEELFSRYTVQNECGSITGVTD